MPSMLKSIEYGESRVLLTFVQAGVERLPKYEDEKHE